MNFILHACTIISDSAKSWTVACQDFPGRNTGVGCHVLLGGIFLTQGSDVYLLHLLHWQADSYQCATCEAHFMWVLLNNASQPLVKLIKLSLGKPCLSLS